MEQDTEHLAGLLAERGIRGPDLWRNRRRCTGGTCRGRDSSYAPVHRAMQTQVVEAYLKGELESQQEQPVTIITMRKVIPVAIMKRDIPAEDMNTCRWVDVVHTSRRSTGPNVGKTCRTHYRGTFNDGTQFDSSYDRGEPLEFICGVGQMIKGFDAAVAGMEVGQVSRNPSDAGRSIWHAGSERDLYT